VTNLAGKVRSRISKRLCHPRQDFRLRSPLQDLRYRAPFEDFRIRARFKLPWVWTFIKLW